MRVSPFEATAGALNRAGVRYLDAEYPRALQAELSPGAVVRFVSITTPIAMKKRANGARPG